MVKQLRYIGRGTIWYIIHCLRKSLIQILLVYGYSENFDKCTEYGFMMKKFQSHDYFHYLRFCFTD